MKTKIEKIHKCYLGKNDVDGYELKIKLKWGDVFAYTQKTKRGKWNIQVYWHNPDTGQDNTIDIINNLNFKNEKEAILYCIKEASDYFDNHKIKQYIDKNIHILKYTRSTL